MKKALFVLLAFASISVVGQVVNNQSDKKYKVELSLKDWDLFIQQLEVIKGKVKNSNLPANEVYYMVDSIITPFQQTSVGQLRQQLAADTTTKKE